MGEELIEQLADLEHERWSGWMKWMFDNWTEQNISRWKQQMITPYGELPEHSKESDRKEARNTMKIVGPLIAKLESENRDLRKAFESASQRVSVGYLKRLLFKCSHCGKDTPLLIDGLLDKANQAIKEM